MGLNKIMHMVLADPHMTKYHTHLIDSPIGKFAILACRAVMEETLADGRVVRLLEKLQVVIHDEYVFLSNLNSFTHDRIVGLVAEPRCKMRFLGQREDLDGLWPEVTSLKNWKILPRCLQKTSIIASASKRSGS